MDMAKTDKTRQKGSVPTTEASSDAVSAFLNQVRTMPVVRTPGRRGRLIFAMDATASRQPTWERASRLHGDMFAATSSLGGLDIQLAWYCGFGEFYASPWLSDGERLAQIMAGVTCMAGETQLRKVLKHALKETQSNKVNAIVFIGDAFEEDVDEVGKLAGQMGLLGVPAFMFHEGGNPTSTFAFRQVAKLSNGAFCHFDSSSARTLRDLLGAVAVFAAGGLAALEDLGRRHGGDVLRIAHQMKGA